MRGSRRDLARLDVRLVEGVDFEHGAGQRGRELPAEELSPQVVGAVHFEADDGVPERSESIDRRVQLAVEQGADSRVDEDRSLPYSSGAASFSPSTGMIARPCLPVDSATSCSSQAPSDSMAGDSTSVSLSRPISAA